MYALVLSSPHYCKGQNLRRKLTSGDYVYVLPLGVTIATSLYALVKIRMCCRLSVWNALNNFITTHLFLYHVPQWLGLHGYCRAQRNVTTLLLQKVHLWLCGKTPARTNLYAKICPLNSVVRPIYGCFYADPDSLPCKRRWRSSSDATRDRSRFSNEALRWRSQEHNLGSIQHPLRGAMTYTSTMQSQQTLFCCNHMSLPDLLLATQGTVSIGTCSTHVGLRAYMYYDSGAFDAQYSDIFFELWPGYKCDFSTTWPFYLI